MRLAVNADDLKLQLNVVDTDWLRKRDAASKRDLTREYINCHQEEARSHRRPFDVLEYASGTQ